jgi:hypothetical protein
MINDLANSNPRPKLVEIAAFVEPVFVPDYNWDELRRVWKAFATVVDEPSSELWEEALKHTRDDRYALTMRNNGPNAKNYSVGDLCGVIVGSRVFFAAAWRSDPDNQGRKDVWLKLGVDDVARWRADRSSKALYELQIEICQRALDELDNATNKDVPTRAKAHIRKQLTAWIDELRTAKQPLFFGVLMDGYEVFNADQAQRIRKRLESQ